MPAASRHGDCRPSAPTASRAASDCAGAVRTPTLASSGRSLPPRHRTASVRKARPRALRAPPSAPGCRYCSRTARDRSRRDANRTSGARIRRPVSSTSRMVCNARRPVAAAPPDIEPLEQIDGRAKQRGGAVVGIGRAAGEQGGLRAGLGQRDRGGQGPPGRRRSRERHKSAMHRSCRNNRHSRRHFQVIDSMKCFHRFARRNAATADMQIARFLIALPPAMDQIQPASFNFEATPRMRAAAFSVHIFTAMGAGIALIGAAGGRARALGQHVRAGSAWR